MIFFFFNFIVQFSEQSSPPARIPAADRIRCRSASTRVACRTDCTRAHAWASEPRGLRRPRKTISTRKRNENVTVALLASAQTSGGLFRAGPLVYFGLSLLPQPCDRIWTPALHATGRDGAPVAAYSFCGIPFNPIQTKNGNLNRYIHPKLGKRPRNSYSSLSNNVASPIRNGRKPVGREALAAMSTVGAVAE